MGRGKYFCSQSIIGIVIVTLEMNWGFKRFRFVLKTEVALSNSHLVSGHFNFSHFDCGCDG
jgi:hypothetical protein